VINFLRNSPAYRFGPVRLRFTLELVCWKRGCARNRQSGSLHTPLIASTRATAWTTVLG